MPKNLDIITKTAYLSATGAAGQKKALGSSVAAGMKRYVTFVRVTQRKATGVVSGGSKVYFTSMAGIASATGVPSTTAEASAGAKLSIFIQSALASNIVSKGRQVPDIPDTANPLFTIAASRWFSAYLGKAATTSSPVQVLVQYYDQ